MTEYMQHINFNGNKSVPFLDSLQKKILAGERR